MDYQTAIVLGILQGVAEFLPISSSGHLVIAGRLLGIREENIALNVALHLGTLGSILVAYRRDLLPALRHQRLMLSVTTATLPLVGVGLFAKNAIDRTFDSPLVAGCGLCLTALLMALAHRVERGAVELVDVSWKQGLVAGLFQAIAVLPGISRSGSTIFGGLTGGLKREAAAHFSFYIAVPAIGGAAVLHAKDLLETGSAAMPVGPMLAGMATSFVVGWLALHTLLRVVSRRKLHWFAWYCAAVGLGTIAWQLWQLSVA